MKFSNNTFLSLLFVTLDTAAFSADLEKIVALQQAQIQKLISENQAMKKDIEENIKKDLATCKKNDSKHEWTEGSLCVLANGSCPAGFTRSEGHIRAISIYEDRANSGSYLRPANFGSSSISWHGSPYQYGTWAGELTLQTCCK